ncbi:hypothetical protein P175DRAFT_0504937 [Aspergillus ochraceoroseus IBT 24754]|uniref:Bacteriocin-protection protein n=3 Tax=Aspergillus subgen. Nidulantes TaxID=2720870 RepID=A0A0F8WX41_9EURO|nr:uncharacterized protein P175DRAFT_0504937 [Aspergillus ochraceoroseus IBT 24754]KKK16354.1 hypothetical protein AOCH_006983 [Aspergillus ochraceoroseus]KKK22110.1 hypothetical protein ARAM_006989 [Aspergillus rambellii]PTU17173.1 hypothetical protein P175DRAFT_0504937 [Aspergillus ochraceoroseus IBT 24754]
MSAKSPPADLPIHDFPSARDLEAFLETEHSKIPGFYLKLAKKSSGITSVSASEAVEVALCFGWIDGRSNAYDHDWWLVRYTPRRTKSLWSQKNVTTAQQLIADGRVRPAGMIAIQAAQADGRWDRAYDGPASITIPADLAAAFTTDQAAHGFFETLNRTDRYTVLHRLQTTSPAQRARRIEALVKSLAKGEILSKLPASKVKGNMKERHKGGITKHTEASKSSRRSKDRPQSLSMRELRPRKPRSSSS